MKRHFQIWAMCGFPRQRKEGSHHASWVPVLLVPRNDRDPRRTAV